MTIDMTVKNYRCFADAKPARLLLDKGCTALVGPNNSGKSAMLRFFYEFRNLFLALSDVDNLRTAFKSRFNFSFPDDVSDASRPFCNGNSRPLGIELQFTHVARQPEGAPQAPQSFDVSVQRDRTASVKINGWGLGDYTRNANFAPILQAIKDLGVVTK